LVTFLQSAARAAARRQAKVRNPGDQIRCN
jgi:hypothetical protein